MTVNSTCAPEVRWMLQQIEMIERSHDVLSPAHYARMRDLAAGRIKPKIITSHICPPIPIYPREGE